MGEAKRRAESAKVGRLAFRQEGMMWNAYYALPGSMEGAIWIGSIAMAGVALPRRRKRYDAFVALMTDMVADIIESASGHRPTYPDGLQPAPEHERSKE